MKGESSGKNHDMRKRQGRYTMQIRHPFGKSSAACVWNLVVR